MLGLAGDRALPGEGDLRALAGHVVRLSSAARLGLATAESCTGGLVGASLTAVPGSSAAFLGGVTSYAIGVKHAVLGVPRTILDDPDLGAVSGECARQMAKGVRALMGADLAVSVTGIAGPTGAEPGKPVGTVVFGLSGPRGSSHVAHLLTGGRDEVRAKATLVALGLLCEELEAICPGP